MLPKISDSRVLNRKRTKNKESIYFSRALIFCKNLMKYSSSLKCGIELRKLGTKNSATLCSVVLVSGTNIKLITPILTAKGILFN